MNTNVIEIKGAVAGSGKTFTLVKLFLKVEHVNSNCTSLILTPTNKSRHAVIDELVANGLTKKQAEKKVKTLRDFKGNYVFGSVLVEGEEQQQYYTVPSKKHKGKAWNLFIDEASMISKAEMDDLTNNFTIQNLVLAGDLNQFEPVPNIQFLKGQIKAVWNDDGTPYDIKPNASIVLDKSFRSHDDKLDYIVSKVKEGKLDVAVAAIKNATVQTPETPNDYFVAYTNSRVHEINRKYKDTCTRWVVSKNDETWGLFKGELYDQKRIDSIKANYELDEDNWDSFFKKHFSKATALTAHKLQGSTIKTERINIDLQDVVSCRQFEDAKTKADFLQKYLYVAVTRAQWSSQVHILDYDKILKNRTFRMLTKLCKPLSEPNVADHNITTSSEDFGSILDFFLSNWSSENPLDEIKEFVSQAHSVKHKQHKQHKHKEYNQDAIQSTLSLSCKEWMSKWGLGKMAYYRYKTMAM